MKQAVYIGNRRISDADPVLVVAEISGNHCQSYEIAEETVRKAKEAGADAVKLQTYTADTITLDANTECFRIKQDGLWDGMTFHQLYKKASMQWEWQPKLKKVADDLGILCFSSPFDRTAVDFLSHMDVPAYKIASPEITDLPLISYAAAQGKPIILSTGIALPTDIEAALAACRATGNDQIILLKCTSGYPTPLDEVNLRTMQDMRTRYGVLTGLSDHTLGIAVPIAAVALGARIIEKHFILDKNLDSPDAAFSLDPAEFAAMVAAVRAAEKALGTPTYELTDKMRISRKSVRSLFIAADVVEGEVATEQNIRSVRPGDGLPPVMLPQLIGKRFKRAYKKGTPLKQDALEVGP